MSSYYLMCRFKEQNLATLCVCIMQIYGAEISRPNEIAHRSTIFGHYRATFITTE